MTRRYEGYRRPRLTMAAALIGIAAATLAGGPAEATNGYFAHGQGTEGEGMVGAGVAMQQGPMAAAVNPALVQKNGNLAGGCVDAFMPHRDATISGTKYDSDSEFFLIPCGGVAKVIDENSSAGVVLIANGGMNTDYGVIPQFGNTSAGVDLAQVFLGPNYARKLGNGFTIGIMPLLAYQRFKATGLQNFDTATRTSAVGSVTNNGYDGSWGYGAKVGLLWDVNDRISVGAAYQSRIYMTEFDKYKGLFAEQGDFDIPAAVRAGIAVRPSETVTVALDFERIFYGDVKAIANTGVAGNGGCFTAGAALLGTDEGCGFGWKDMNVWRLGVEWQTTDTLTLRAGYSHASDFTEDAEVGFNILAPATIKRHASVGFTYAVSDSWSFSGAYTRGFDHSITGQSATLGNATVKLRMDQHIASVGATYRW